MKTLKEEWEERLTKVRETMRKCSQELWELRPEMERWSNWSQMQTAKSILENVCFTIDALEESINTEDE